MMRLLALLSLLIFAPSVCAQTPPPAGTWAQIPSTSLAGVVWKDAQGRTVNELKGADAVWGSLWQWVGAGYRYDTDVMVFAGLGGDGGGASNEVWSINFQTKMASRDFNPTVDLIPDRTVALQPINFPPYKDMLGKYGPVGKLWPASAHRYGATGVHLPGTDKMFVGGGVAWGGPVGSRDIFLWDMAAKTWEYQEVTPRWDLITAIWDPTGQRVLYFDGDGLMEWVPSKPVGQRQQRLIAFAANTSLNRFWTLVVDEKRNEVIAAGVVDNGGTGTVVAWNLGTKAQRTIVPAGVFQPWEITSPGFDRDPVRDRLLLYAGGATLYWIHPDSGQIDREATQNPPPRMDTNGIFGRFRYSRNLKQAIYIQDMIGGAWMIQPVGPAAGPTPVPIPTPTPTPTPTPFPGLTAGTLKALPLPSRGVGIASETKHVNAALHPPSGRIFFEAGDYSGLVNPGIQSYRQETWSLDLAARLASSDPASGWTLEYPYCGYGGTSVQPKHPDFVGWQWDAARAKFWMVPGVMEMLSSEDCGTAETPTRNDDPNFLHMHLMSFDPAKPGPQRWADEGGSVGPDWAETWMSVLDPMTDTMHRMGYNGGSGFVINILDLKTKTWRVIGGGSNALGKDPNVSKSPLAHDAVNRHVYMVDSWAGRLHRYSIATGKVEDLGPIPGGGFSSGDGTIFSPLSWDSRNKLALFSRNDTRGFFAYHPDTATWETLSPTVDPPGVSLPFVRTMFYHPAFDAHVMLDILSSNLFVYRYLASGAPAPVPVPMPTPVPVPVPVPTPIPTPTPVATLVANPATITVGQSSILTLTTPTPDYHSIRINSEIPACIVSGPSRLCTLLVTPATTTVYQSAATDGVIPRVMPSVAVTVQPLGPAPTPVPIPVPPPAPVMNPRIDIKRTPGSDGKKSDVYVDGVLVP